MENKTKINMIYQAIQLESIDGYLNNSIDFFERKVRRWFSRAFSTPLLETYKISWELILLHYYENSLENKSYNEVYELACQEYLPEITKQKEAEDEEFIKQLEKEQEDTLKLKENKVKNINLKFDDGI